LGDVDRRPLEHLGGQIDTEHLVTELHEMPSVPPGSARGVKSPPRRK
jgi:hypothetical protein